MKVVKFLLTFLMIMSTCMLLAADRLAVAEPVGKGGVQASDIEAFWGILESSIHSEQYTLISRSALKQMLTEIGLTVSSDLVNLNSQQQAKLGQLEGVKYILVSEIAKFGSKLNCTLRILDVSTGEIDQKRTANLRVRDLDELADRIEGTLEKLLADDKQMPESALLRPNFRLTETPSYLELHFSSRLENGLLNGGVPLQNLRSVQRILDANNLGRLDEVEPKTYRRIGELLEVKNLIQPTITRFEIASIPYRVAETGASGYRYIGYLDGYVRVISAQNGRVLANVVFTSEIDFRAVPYQTKKNWLIEDYGKYAIDLVMNQRILPELLQVKELRGK